MNQTSKAGMAGTAGAVSLCLIAASLVAYQPGGLFRFTWIKIVVLLVALGFGLFAARKARLPGAAIAVLWIGSGVLFVAIARSVDPLASFVGRWPRYEGAATLGLYLAMLALGARLLGGGGSVAAWALLHRVLAVASLALATISLLEAVGLRPLGGAADLRPGATLGNATDQGLVGVMIAGLLSRPALMRGGTWRWLLRSGLAAAVLTAVLSGSRAALLGLVLVAATGALFGFGDKKARLFPRAGIAIGSILALTLLVVFSAGTRERLFSPDTVSGRWLLWQQSLMLIKDHWLAGLGPSGFVDAIPGYETRQWAQQFGDSFPPDSPHMWILQALVAGGVPLLVSACALGILVLRYAVEQIRNAPDKQSRANLVGAFAAVIAYGAGLLTHFSSPGTTPLALLVCGGLIATTTAPSGRLIPDRLRTLMSAKRFAAARTIGAATALAAALAVAVPATIAEWPMAAGARAVGTGDTALAEQHFQLAYQLRPWDSDTALLAAQAFAGDATNGDQAAATHAVEWASISTARTPDSVEAGLALAIGHIYSGDLAAGRDVLDALIIKAPNSSGLYTQRGVAEFGLGEPERSISDLKTAASLSPDSPTPLRILAQVYERLGEVDNATEAAARADQLGG
ncbi:O-antigen ligase family protein [Pseudarthrobacter sp. P1]|uniref:O-antigen ligase family protein n=1 Tax=Pseudarthrobacter sp. P1 TaxID=3418418 RepID=UPI003CF47526